MKSLFTATLTALLLASPCQGQKVWTLDECIAYALEHNPQIWQQSLSSARQKNTYIAQRMGRLPKLSISLGQDYSWGRSVDMQELVIVHNKLTKSTAATAEASLVLFNGLTREYDILAAKRSWKASEKEKENAQLQIELSVIRAYLQLMLAEEVSSLAISSLVTTVIQSQSTARLVQAGKQPQNAIEQMEAQLAEKQALLVDAQCSERNARHGLMQLMNLPFEEGFICSRTGFFDVDSVAPGRIPSLTADEIEEYALSHPGYAAARFYAEEKEFKLKSARGAFLPSLTLSAGLGTYYSNTSDASFGSQFSDNRNPSLGLTLNIPVFTGLQATTLIRNSSIDLQIAQLEQEKTRIELNQEISSATIEADNCLQRYETCKRSAEAMGTAASATRARFEAGAASAIDCAMADDEWMKAESERLRAKWQLIFQIKLLEIYTR